MKSKQKLWEICMEIYRKMYKEAEPTADFDKLIKEKKTVKENWFLNYYLAESQQQDIISEICTKHKCTKLEVDKICLEVVLGSSPRGIKNEVSSV